MEKSKPARQTYTVAEVSQLLGIPIRTVYDVISRGDFPSMRFGRRVVVPRWAIDELLKPKLQTLPDAF